MLTPYPGTALYRRIARENVFGGAPSWFAPKSVADYEAWIFADEPQGHFTVLIDKASGHIFMNDYQV